MNKNKPKDQSAQEKIQETIRKTTLPPDYVEPQQIMIVQKKTGEIHEVADIMTADQDFFRRKANYQAQKKIKFAVIMQERLLELLPELTPSATKLLLALIGKIYLHNRCYKVTILELSKTTGMHYNSVKKAVKELKAKNIIVNTGEKHLPVYFLDPTLSFKGTFAYQQKMQIEFDRNIEKNGTGK